MGNYFSKQRPERPRDTEASSPTTSKRRRREKLVELQSEQRESESPHLLPSSDSLEKIDMPPASGSNSDPSASSTSVNGNNYYVFLSFRGPDTRKGFVDHLYQRLKAVGLRCHANPVFRDDEDLPFGENIGENLISAIERSKVSIPVISENYAASKWCLRELIHIMKCKESRGQIVLPVLYKVKTDDVKHMRGKFGEAFKSSMHRFKEDVKQQGPEALRKALTLRVYESENFSEGREGELVNELIEIILREQQHDFQPHLPVNLVAIEDRVAEVMALVDLACSDTRIIGIWGMGGIGKTTLATIIYKKLFDNFQCRSYLKDIRETINHEGVKHVQSLLLSDIRKCNKSTVRDPEMGIDMIRSSCEKKKVLILLDDVDHPNHLDNLIGGCKFLLGSRIIFTSRHKAIICQDEALLKSTYWYELKKMDSENSLLLFSMHAFGKKPPPIPLVFLSRDIVDIIGGLPLALTVIGLGLKGEEDQGIWGEMLEKLRNVPDEKVQQQLRISYDLLEDNVKKMFLDIACFFIGIDKRIAPYLWDQKLCPRTGLKKLIDRSLINVDNDNELTMLDELRDLGKSIARPANKKLRDCSRLWDEEAMIILRSKEENENIEALWLDIRGSREFMNQESFKKMPNLKFLHVKDVHFYGDFKESLVELRWLKWEKCHVIFEATNVHLKKLIVLDLSVDYSRRNNISEYWRGWSSIKMERLKVLNLSRCLGLQSTPNLSAFKNLELLILEHCLNLKEIDPSIGDVKCLLFLNLRYCDSLKKLPEQLGELENLEELVIDKTKIEEIPPCIGSLKKLKRLSAIRLPLDVPLESRSKLQWIPSSIGELGELVELNLSYTGITELPRSIGKLNKLKILKIDGTRIERLPYSIGKLQSLQELDAGACFDLKGQILVDKSGLSSLKTLVLSFTYISGLPKNLDQLSSLEHLDLYCCKELQSLPKPPCSLSFLRLTCRSNKLPSLSHLKNLKELTLNSCMSLQSIPELPSCIRKLDVSECPKLERLPKLSDLEFLSELRLIFCNRLKQLDGLKALKSLRKLDLSRRPYASSMEDFDEEPDSDASDMEDFDDDFDEEPDSYASVMEDFDEEPDSYASVMEDFDEVTYSCVFDMDDFKEEIDKLHAIEGLEKLGSLEEVDISARKHIQVLDLSKSEHLKYLNVGGCKSLVEIRCPSKFLEYFNRNGCESLKKLPDFLPHDLWGKK